MSKSNSDEKRYNFQEVPKNKAVQYDELDKILLKLTGSKGVNRRNSVTGEKRNEAKQAIEALKTQWQLEALDCIEHLIGKNLGTQHAYKTIKTQLEEANPNTIRSN